MQDQHREKHLLPSSGKAAWMTPHKSAHKRLKNRATRYAGTLVASLLDLPNLDNIDIDWNRQILWYADLRVAAFRKSDLIMDGEPTSHEIVYQDPRSHEELPFHLDLTKLSKASGKEAPALLQAAKQYTE